MCFSQDRPLFIRLLVGFSPKLSFALLKVVAVKCSEIMFGSIVLLTFSGFVSSVFGGAVPLSPECSSILLNYISSGTPVKFCMVSF